MILPVVAYGQSILRKECKEIAENNNELQELVTSMWETLYHAHGMGLAAPQVGFDLRLFIVDTKQVYDPDDREMADLFIGDEGIIETFINPKIEWHSEETWSDYEGCLSIPSLSEVVERPISITIRYLNRDFELQETTFSGETARVIQHEYDHLDGILYVDKIAPVRKNMIRSRLKRISLGKETTKYKMKF